LTLIPNYFWGYSPWATTLLGTVISRNDNREKILGAKKANGAKEKPRPNIVRAWAKKYPALGRVCKGGRRA
jgi:hypothetical protein